MAATKENKTETHSEVGTEAGHEAGGNFPPFDSSTFASQLLWLAITFGLFYYLMSKVVLPRISDILEVRSDRIAQDLDEANRLKQESDEAIAAYEQELAEAKSKAHAIAVEASDKAKAEAETYRQKVEAELTAKLSIAEDKIAEIKKAALSEVGSIAQDTTTVLVNELLGGKISKTVVASAIKQAGKS